MSIQHSDYENTIDRETSCRVYDTLKVWVRFIPRHDTFNSFMHDIWSLAYDTLKRGVYDNTVNAVTWRLDNDMNNGYVYLTP